MQDADLVKPENQLVSGDATEPRHSIPVRKRETQYGGQERARAIRRERAIERAGIVLRNALSDTSTSDLLAAVLARLPEHLGTDECDLIRLEGDHSAVLYRIERTQNDDDSRQSRSNRRKLNDSKGGVQIESVHLQSGQTPLNVLRGVGLTDRIYVFVRGSAALEPLGILAIATPARCHMSADDRAFLDALADLLSHELERETRPLTDKSPSATEHYPVCQ